MKEERLRWSEEAMRSADAQAFANAIRIAIVEIEYDVPRKIESLLSTSLISGASVPAAVVGGD